MINKYLTFAKNAGLATIGAVACGYVGAELSDLVTNSELVKSWVSTGSQYFGAIGTFLYFHSKDFPEDYREENSHEFKYTKLSKNLGKLSVPFVAIDIAYFFGRTSLETYLQRKGFEPGTASLVSDTIAIPSYCLVAIPLADKLGFIKQKKA